MKLIAAIAMHGRNETVQECIDRMPFIEKYYVCSELADSYFLLENQQKVIAVQNEPLSYKWKSLINSLRHVDFDAVMILGSDDYICENLFEYAKKQMKRFDVFGFLDIYFYQGNEYHYWGGYTDRTEPIGAGRCYTKAFLESIDYQLYDVPANSGLDRMAWYNVLRTDATIGVTSIREEGLILVDIKDGQGITPITSIPNRILVDNPHGNKTTKEIN
jgi:hypothetical protein